MAYEQGSSQPTQPAPNGQAPHFDRLDAQSGVFFDPTALRPAITGVVRLEIRDVSEDVYWAVYAPMSREDRLSGLVRAGRVLAIMGVM